MIGPVVLCHSTGQSVVKMAYLIDPSNGSGSLLVRAPLGDTKDQTWLPNGGCNIHSVYLGLGKCLGLMHNNRSPKWIGRLNLFNHKKRLKNSCGMSTANEVRLEMLNA